MRARRAARPRRGTGRFPGRCPGSWRLMGRTRRRSPAGAAASRQAPREGGRRRKFAIEVGVTVARDCQGCACHRRVSGPINNDRKLTGLNSRCSLLWVIRWAVRRFSPLSPSSADRFGLQTVQLSGSSAQNLVEVWRSVDVRLRRSNIPTKPPPGRRGNRARDRSPSAPRARALPVQTCSSSCSYRLRLLRSWSLRQTPRGSQRSGRPS